MQNETSEVGDFDLAKMLRLERYVRNIKCCIPVLVLFPKTPSMHQIIDFVHLSCLIFNPRNDFGNQKIDFRHLSFWLLLCKTTYCNCPITSISKYNQLQLLAHVLWGYVT